ncbi:MAG: hypothetical protein M1817_001609 [Caeruleum heppii]|nr:MAG: hypothetical protein M1817_001609 [Caeruleum heppii]
MTAETRPSHHASSATKTLDPSHPSTSTASARPDRKHQYPDASVPSFSAFRAQAAPTSATGVRRKPLPPTSSPLASRASSVSGGDLWNGPGPAQHDIVPDSRRPSSIESARIFIRDLDKFPRGQSPLIPSTRDGFRTSTTQAARASRVQSARGGQFRQTHGRLASESSVADRFSRSVSSHDVQTVPSEEHRPSSAMSLHPSTRPSNLHLQLDNSSRKSSNQTEDSFESGATSKPRSPGAKLTSFFGWKSSSPGAGSSRTSFSDKDTSPVESPRSPKSPIETSPTGRVVPAAIDVSKANAVATAPFGLGAQQPPLSPAISVRVDEMEEELKDISTELASSIRREMDLEDLVERLQSEVNQPPVQNRRTSDYFSDSGTSSVRYPLGDTETKELELEKAQRKTEQERAQLRLDLTQKVQQERARRKALEAHVKVLEEQVQKVDHDQLKSADATGRVHDLEASLEDLRRRLSEERQVKENFQDLLSALKGEIQEHRNERDNLRDEIVPQLRARVEGLESEAAEHQKLTYENARMQQELQSLKNENTTLINARRLQLEMQQQQGRISSIAEEGIGSALKAGLTRSNTVARGSALGSQKSGGLSRSNSVKERESRDSLADRVKDIEAQRDALHRALKSLLDRQDFQKREADKRVRALEIERDRALTGTPRRGYNKEVSHLREEINHLRRRADEALEQKWQCEKGLSGLKMDLDRAEQETSSLRSLLQEHDILIPEFSEATDAETRTAGHVTSESLEKTYKELQATHTMSLRRIQELERGVGQNSSLGAADDEARRTMALLQMSISDAEAERDSAHKQADDYRRQAESLQAEGRDHLVEEEGLADQLRASAQRVEELAGQVRQQLASNRQLRHRLAEAIGRGEREQKVSATRIIEMQGKLKGLEDKVMAAQQHSEDAVQKHEEEVKELRESHSAQLQRMKSGFMSPKLFSPKTPISPLFTSRSPKLDVTTSGLGVSMTEDSKTAFLEKRVEELETALGLADKEMEEVVSRMNMAQIEVMELQSERDEAMRQSRRLQKEINQEREKVKTLMG